MFTVALDLSEFRVAKFATFRAIDDNLVQSVTKAANEGASEAKRVGQFKDRTGNLRRSIYAKTGQSNDYDVNAEIVSPMPYSQYVEAGTRAHEIRPKEGHGFHGPLQAGQSRRAKTDIGTHRVALRWYVGGRAVFASVVHHPGSRAFSFMAPAYIKAEAVLYASLESGFDRIEQIWI